MTKVLEKLAEYETKGGALVQQTSRLATSDGAIELLREQIFQK